MKINEKTITNSNELISIIKEGQNPLNYINDISDIEFITKTITHNSKNPNPYFDDMSEILLKALIIYTLSEENN